MMPRGFANTSDFIRWNEAMSQKYDSESYDLRSSFIIRWIERRRQKTKRRLARYRAALNQANGEQLPLPANSLRQIVCTEVIEHVLNPRNVVEEMARVAPADAVLVITIPNEALIDWLKRIVGKLGLQRWLLPGAGDEAHGATAYDSPDSANEWHLHHFDMALLRQVTRGVLSITAVKAIPFRLLPLRYVVSCRVVPTGT
jgi:2-polyprenyl-3-methyl-5-hydroxy-6-metoxy-1,4-benzoquinol methylase